MNDVTFARRTHGRLLLSPGHDGDHTALPSADGDLAVADADATLALQPEPGASFLTALAAGIVALAPNPAGWRYALMPSQATRKLVVQHGIHRRSDVILMTRHAFRAMLRRGAAPEIADMAAHDLGRRFPDMSAETAASWGRRAATAALTLCCIVIAAAAPAVALAVAAILTVPLFLGMVLLRCGAVIEAWTPTPTPVLRLKDQELPLYTVLAPLFREEAVVPQFVGALARLDYPPDRLEIKFLVEADDAGTRLALEALKLPSHMEIVIVPPGQPRTKPRAMNAGLLEARGVLVTIFDAEDRPDPRQLRLAANLFARLPTSVACLQGRLVIDNVDDSWLTRMFALEYAALFDVINAGLLRAGVPVLLGGTSNHFRTGALRSVGGWDAFNVTEDADLSFRLTRAGYHLADLPSATLEEAPARFGSWRRQRTRWIKGFIQTLITHTRQPVRLFRDAGPRKGLSLLALCGGTVLSALCFPVFLAATLAGLFTWGVPRADTAGGALLIGVWGALFGAGLAAIYLPVMLGAARRGLSDLKFSILCQPIYCCLISAAAWAAVLELITAPTRWNKTDHGLAKTSRSTRDVTPSRSRPAP